MSHQKSEAQIAAEAEYQFAYTCKLQQTSYGAKLSPGTAKISQESVNDALIKFYQKMLQPVEPLKSLHEYYVQADLKWRDFRVPAMLKGVLVRPASIDDLVAMMVVSESQLHQWAMKKNPTVTFIYPKEIKQIFCDTLRQVVHQGEIDNPVSWSQSSSGSSSIITSEKKIKYRNILCCLLQSEYVHPFFRSLWVVEALLDAGCTLGSSSHNLCQFEKDHRWQLIHHFILSRGLFISSDLINDDDPDGKEFKAVAKSHEGDNYEILQLLLSHGCPSPSTSLSSERKVDCNTSSESKSKWDSNVMNHLLTTYFFTTFKHQSKIDTEQVRADIYSKQYPVVNKFVKLFVSYGACPFKNHDSKDDKDKTVSSAALFDEKTVTTVMRDLTRVEPKYLNGRITAFCCLKFLLAKGLDPDTQIALPADNGKQKLMRYVRTSPRLVALIMRYGGSITNVFTTTSDTSRESEIDYSKNEDIYNQGYLLGIDARERQLAAIAKKQQLKLLKLSK